MTPGTPRAPARQSRSPATLGTPQSVLWDLWVWGQHPPTDWPIRTFLPVSSCSPSWSQELRSPRPAMSGQSSPTGPPGPLPANSSSQSHPSSPWRPRRSTGRRYPDLYRMTCSHFPCKLEQGHLSYSQKLTPRFHVQGTGSARETPFIQEASHVVRFPGLQNQPSLALLFKNPRCHSREVRNNSNCRLCFEQTQ